MTDGKISIKAALAIITTVTLWASAFVVIRIGLQGYHPGSLALLRYLIASAGMLVLYLMSPKRSKIAPKDILPLALTGIIGIGIYNITLNYGEVSVTAGISCFIVSMIPVAVMLLAVLFLGEVVSLKRWIGFIISVCGVTIIAISHSSGDERLDRGIIYLLIAMLSGGIYSVLSRVLAVKYRPIELTAFIIWSGTLLMLIYLPDLHKDLHTATLKSTLAVIYLGIFPAIGAYAAWSYVLRYIPASRASSYLYAMPLVATLLGWLLLSEVPHWLGLVGGIIALLGAYIANQRPIGRVKKNGSCAGAGLVER